MSIIRDILKYHIITILITFILIAIILIITFSLLNIIFPGELFNQMASIIIGLTSLFSSIIALSLPFIMKDIENKEKRNKEINKIKIIFFRLKQYFEYLLLTERNQDREFYISYKVPFFSSLAQNLPNLLIKLGIQVEQYETRRGTIGFNLYILDKYQLSLGYEPFIKKVRVINNIKPSKEEFEKILEEIIDYTEKNFNIRLDKKLAEFE